MADVSVLGAGSWGIALSVVLSENGHNVTIWSISESEIDMLNTYHEQKEKLPGVILPDDMTFTTDLREACHNKDLLVLAVPSVYTRSTSALMSPVVEKDQVIVNVAKGLEESSLMTLSQIIEEEIPQAKVAVMSGPSHAEEVGEKIPTTIVVGAKCKETAEFVQNIFMNEFFRVYISPDVLGIELGGALKNVVALAAGMADGLGYGDNTKAALITRGIAEMARLGIAMGGKPDTFAGLSGIGDLVVTCTSMHSRNRRFGILVGEGMPLDQALDKVGMVVEGYYTQEAVDALASKYNVEMPITQTMHRLLAGEFTADECVAILMGRKEKHE